MYLRTIIGLAVAAGLLLVQPASAGTSRTARPGEAYCVQHGGVVQTRIPEYGTNGGNPLILSGSAQFCQFTREKDGSQINVLLSTLETRDPTLAALAYYAQVPLGSCTGNPGSCYCSQVGGTDLFGGVNAAGGGWVLDSDPNDVLEACIFPDMSSIDSWGLAYHSADIVRGKNLAKVLRYGNPYDAKQNAARKPKLPF
jgi:putative hemolysin